MTYELTLREGLKYSDGTPVKASDFEHTIKRVLNLESGGIGLLPRHRGRRRSTSKTGKAEGDISGIETDDKTGDDHDQPDRARRHVLERAGDVVRRRWCRATRRSRT